MLAVALFSAAYLQMPLNELPEIALYALAMMIREPIFINPLVVADVALFALVMIAKISQLRSILRCYVYAGIGYAIGIYLIRSGYDHALFVAFYGPLIGWAIAVIQNHFGPMIWSYLVNRTRLSKTRPLCS
jgi:hypothetical protein